MNSGGDYSLPGAATAQFRMTQVQYMTNTQHCTLSAYTTRSNGIGLLSIVVPSLSFRDSGTDGGCRACHLCLPAGESREFALSGAVKDCGIYQSERSLGRSRNRQASWGLGGGA